MISPNPRRPFPRLPALLVACLALLPFVVLTGCHAGPGAFSSRRGGFASPGAGIPDYRPGSDELWILAEGGATDEEPRSGGPGSGAMIVRDPEQGAVPLPLRRTDVRARLRGYLSTVDVQQRFHNPYGTKIEAVYVFPLPDDAAVRGFVMAVGERRIRGIVRPREEAERIYREARRQGHRAALLEQERPNVFEQAVANLEPGDEIDVHIRYFHTLPFASGGYEFVFPMVVGPRYNPKGWRHGIGAVPPEAPGSSGQPAEVAYLPPGARGRHALALTVDLDAGVPLRGLESPSHDIRVHRTSATAATVTLADGDVVPDRDFVLRYRVAGERTRARLLTHRDDTGGYLTLMVQPPAGLGDLPRQPMEMIFVLDGSGSMAGAPLRQAVAATELALDRLTPADSFRIIRFSDDASSFSPGLVPATAENVEHGRNYLHSLSAVGGTEMLSGLGEALDTPHDEGKLRFVVFLTDGFIGNERQVLAEVRRRIGSARVFSLGIGSSVNRYLMEGMARLGRGAAGYLLHDGEPGRTVAELYDRITHPVMTDVRIDWGALEVADVHPCRLPDLFVGRPLVLAGRVLGGRPEGVRVLGRVGGRPVALEVRCEQAPADDGLAALPALWARRKIRSLSDFASIEGLRAERDRVQALALEYGLMSAFTSFVAVDASEGTAGDHGIRVPVPVPVPAGVRYETTVEGK